MSESTAKPLILQTNDDGPFTRGLRAVREFLQGHGRVITVVPLQEMSGSSHALTLNRPLRIKEIEPDFYAVDGTPADSCYMGLFHLLQEEKPDLIVSGLNNGYNMGEDVVYSGTVAGAMEGYFHGISGVALSAKDFSNLEQVCEHANRLVGDALKTDGKFLLNVNYPTGDVKGTRMTRLCSRVYPGNVVRCSLERHENALWIGGVPPVWSDREGTDIDAVLKGYASVTPLHPDMTDERFLQEHPQWPR